jgi:hypothetical protein
MKNGSRGLLVLLFLAGTDRPGTAATQEPASILSWGADSCGKFIQADASVKSLYVDWSLGFISGGNVWDTGRGRLAGEGWDQAGVTVWLTNYCNAHPLDEFVNASLQLRKEFGGHLPSEQGR